MPQVPTYARVSIPRQDISGQLPSRAADPTRRLHPSGEGSHRFYRFRQETIAQFRSEFTADARLGTKRGMQAAIVRRHLEALGVRPMLSCREAGISICCPGDVPEFEVG